MNERSEYIKAKRKVFSIRKELGSIEKTGHNPFFKNDYVELSTLLDLLNPLLEKHNCLLEQPQEIVDGKNVQVSRIWDLDSGLVILESKLILPTDKQPQEMCSATTYYARYTLLRALALKTIDDDGNTASNISTSKEVKGYDDGDDYVTTKPKKPRRFAKRV